jgi:hypothetical protein
MIHELRQALMEQQLHLLNERETAKRLGMHPPGLRRWRQEKRGLPFVRIGRLIRYRPEDIEAFISGNTQHPKDNTTEVL